MPYIKTAEQFSLFYTDYPGDEPVVFAHAWALNGDMWSYQLTDLMTAGFRCITYDRRGHGRSDRPPTGYDIDTLADDLAAVIEGLDLYGITLIGHSMGTAEVVRYLTRHGAGRIARVVLSGT
ncbi:MAG: alpha/beta fold hydrolase, partial [Mycobacterium sp.]|uniref:alpha/beta fold hydrolase n=1 Tax=Mycobacterium sp. TaxID=1785 RepID=UPI003BB0D557